MCEIICYEKKYEDKVRAHIADICVDEYGFKEWNDYIQKTDFSCFKKENGNFWLLINNDEVIGTIGLKKIDNNIGEIKNFYINKAYRGKGFSKKLMDTLVNFAIDNQYKTLQLDTYKKFERAREFYSKYGFDVIEDDGEKFIYQKNI